MAATARVTRDETGCWWLELDTGDSAEWRATVNLGRLHGPIVRATLDAFQDVELTAPESQLSLPLEQRRA